MLSPSGIACSGISNEKVSTWLFGAWPQIHNTIYDIVSDAKLGSTRTKGLPVIIISIKWKKIYYNFLSNNFQLWPVLIKLNPRKYFFCLFVSGNYRFLLHIELFWCQRCIISGLIHFLVTCLFYDPLLLLRGDRVVDQEFKKAENNT